MKFDIVLTKGQTEMCSVEMLFRSISEETVKSWSNYCVSLRHNTLGPESRQILELPVNLGLRDRRL